MPTHFTGTPQEISALNTFIKLTRASESLLTRLYRGGTQGDLTPSQFAVMEVLYHLGPMCQSDIGSKLLKSSGNITLVIDNLEKRSLVRRQRDDNDRRMVQVQLTDTGRTMISQLFPAHLAAIVEELSVLDLEEQEILGRLCRKLGSQDSPQEYKD